MYRTSRKGTDYYACMPGYVHSHPVCQKVDYNKTARITGLTHRDVFHAWLMTQPRPAGSPGPDPGPGPGPGSGGSVVKALPYRSLEDLYNNGLHRCDFVGQIQNPDNYFLKI